MLYLIWVKMRKIIFFLLILFCSLSLALGEAKEPVYLIPIKGVIDLGLSGFLKRALNEARTDNAKIVILEIDTFGGRVDAAVEICQYLEDIKPIPTVAFIDDQAWSAGALITLACNRIIMSPGSSIGSAEPRAAGFMQQDELTDEKTVSAIRAKFKAVAESNNHPANLALAMVDKDVELKKVRIKDRIEILTAEELEEKKTLLKEKDIQILKTINPKGKLLNLSAQDAKEFNLAEAVISSREELLNFLNLKDQTVIEKSLNWSEVLVRFLTHPIVSSLLLTLGFLGILFELKIPGWGISGTLGILFLALFFWGHYLVGLSTWTEVIIFFLGILLLLLEILVIPGFGITGISGIVLILLGIFLSLVKHPFALPKAQLIQAFYTLSFAIITAFAGIVISWKFLPQTKLWKRITLNVSETKEAGFTVAPSLEAYLGKTGRTFTVLRPSGRAKIEEKILDVITEGEFIEKDKEIKVVKVEGNKITVKEV